MFTYKSLEVWPLWTNDAKIFFDNLICMSEYNVVTKSGFQ